VEVVLVAAEGHPLVTGGAPLSLSDLQRHVELTVHDSSESKRLSDARLFGGRRVFFLSDFFTKKQAIAMGLGFGWMPVSLIENELSRGTLREVPFRSGPLRGPHEAGSRYAFAPMMVHPRDRPLGRAGSLLLELLSATRLAPSPPKRGARSRLHPRAARRRGR
jgi:DNA-binding transcriptional LysR family regulator